MIDYTMYSYWFS